MNENTVFSPPSYNSPSILRRMIKILIGIMVLGIFSFLIISVLNSQKKQEKAALTYWGLWEDKNIMQSVISDFERKNQNIKINYEKQEIKDYRERLTTRIYNGTGPDIFRFHNTWTLMLKRYLSPISSDVIQNEDFRKQFYPVAQKDLIKNGAIYGIPSGIDTLALFINTDSFKAAGLNPPKTWDEFSKSTRILTIKDENGIIKNAGAAMGTFDNITHSPDIISLLLIQNGTDLENLSQTSKNASDTLLFYTDFAKGQEKVWDDTQDSSINVFASGNLSMYFGYSWDIFIIKALNPSLNFAVYPVPHLPDRNMTIASYWADGVSVKSKHQKEAMLFMKFLSQRETAQKLFTEESKTRLFGQPYAGTDLAETLKANDLIYPFVSQAREADSSFFASGTFDNGLNSQMNNYLGNAIRSILGNTSSQTALEVLIKGVEQVLQQYAR